MITGFLQQWHIEKRYFPVSFDKAISFLFAHDPLRMEPGNYPIDGDRIFAMVQDVTTQPSYTRSTEIHKSYIDIQVVHSGRECQLYCPLPPVLPPIEDKLETHDFAFYPHPENAGAVILLPDQYAIYFPYEQHCSMCAVESPEEVRKTVLKIHVSCIG